MTLVLKPVKRLIFLVLLPVFILGFLNACGSDDDDEDTATATSLAFSDVSSIIEASCGGGDCHGSGAGNNVYVGNETLVNSNAAAITTRVEATGGTMMPPETATDKALSAADKTTLLNYLSQQ
ncbi:MAG: hypothetical protein AB8G05_07160 [Oligoflexales bacterium]